MLRNIVLSVFVIVLLSSCVAVALPETASETHPADFVTVSDGRLLKEQLERQATQSAGNGLATMAEAPAVAQDGRAIKASLEYAAHQSAGNGLSVVGNVTRVTDGRLIKAQLERQATQSAGNGLVTMSDW